MSRCNVPETMKTRHVVTNKFVTTSFFEEPSHVALRRPETMKSAVRSPAFRRKRRMRIHSVTPNASA